MTRRDWYKALAALGVGPATFHRALAAQAAKEPEITAEMVAQAEWVAGLTLTEDQRKEILSGLRRSARSYKALRAVPLPNHVPPAFAFVPAPPPPPPAAALPKTQPPAAVKRPESDDDLAFLPVTSLAYLVRTKQVTSTELTKLYLARLKKYDPTLKCVVALTEELAIKRAAKADEEFAAGKYRGPLHGIPWGAKDLIAVPGYPTTWGATPYKHQRFDSPATVVKKLDDAGAVLVAKLSLGALAMGDKWFGGTTRNPWNQSQGSSGSSAGSASAVVAGLVGFAIGSETLGSIVSPCTRCGATGLRPTFGHISRAGCMTLSWTMDKLGPICRSVEDCALVLAATHGSDPLDAAAVDRPFVWPPARKLTDVKVGYVESSRPLADRPELTTLRELGVTLIEIKLPDSLPVGSLNVILNAESACAFDDVTRNNVTEGLNDWPASFRRGQFIPAVEYIRANRIRTLVMKQMADLMETVDLYVGGNDLLLTNLTGHPTVVLPNGFRKSGDNEVPTAVTFTGRLYGEAELLAVAKAYQVARGHHLRRPPLDG